MSKTKTYECFKCGFKIERDDPEGVVYEIPTQNKKKHYYLCSSCHDEGGASEKDPCFETKKDIEELFEETS